MKTVIQVVQHLSPGGIEVMALELKKFNQQHARIKIVSLEGTLDEMLKSWPRLQEYKNDLIFLNKKPGIDLGVIAKLTSIFKTYKTNSVHTHHIGPLIYGGIAARLSGVKNLIHTEHDSWHLEDIKRRKLEKFILFLTRPRLVADGLHVAKGLKKQLKCKQVKIIKNGIDVETFCPGDKMLAREIFNLDKEIKLVGCSGRMEAVKGHKHLLLAIAQLPERVHLALAGCGSMEKILMDFSYALGISHRVHFLGKVDNMPQFYQSLDLFCLPSLKEGFPLSPLEAQACGIPAVVTDSGGTAETLCNKTGLLVAPGNCSELAHALLISLNKKQTHDSRLFIKDSGNIKDMAKAYARLCKLLEEAA